MVSVSLGLSHFYHVVPLYTEEREFEKANGIESIQKQIEDMAAPTE